MTSGGNRAAWAFGKEEKNNPGNLRENKSQGGSSHRSAALAAWPDGPQASVMRSSRPKERMAAVELAQVGFILQRPCPTRSEPLTLAALRSSLLWGRGVP